MNETPTKEVVKEPIKSPITLRDIQRNTTSQSDGYDDSAHVVLLIGCPKAPNGHWDYHVDKEKGILTCTFCKKDFTEEMRSILLKMADEWGIKLST